MEVVKIKMPINIWEMSQTGYIKAQNLLDILISKPFITKKVDNVVLRLDNLLVHNKEIVKAEYDSLMNEVILYLKEE